MGSAGGYALIMEFEHRWLGRVGYDEAHALQRRILADRIAGRGRDTLLTLEHDPVMTLGRNADRSHLLLAESEYAARGIAVRQVERGGEVTYHGPGHLVMYPIVALRQGGITLRAHIRALEAALVSPARQIFLVAQRDPKIDEPLRGDLFDMGVVARVVQSLRLPNGNIETRTIGCSKKVYLQNLVGRRTSNGVFFGDFGRSWIILSNLSPMAPFMIA